MHLHLCEYQSPSHWRWRLDDAAGNFLADHEARLDPNAPEYRGLTDLPGYLNHYGGADEAIRPHAELLEELGAWLGEQVFDGLLEAMRQHQTFPATPIHVHLPPAAQHLIQAPLELAHLDGQPLARHGIRFIYQGETIRSGPNKPMESPFRVLAVFSLPDGASPLNLRRERYLLKQSLATLAETRGLALELRVLQYGATRATLKAALQDGRGWDLIHFSGHGHKGVLFLEDATGQADRIETCDLKPLLRLAKRRLKLLTLSACHSGANLDLPDFLAMLRRAGPGSAPAENTVYPSIAQELATELDCAVLAMRYPVGDQFAIDLGLALYRGLLQDHQPLPGALQLAMEAALEHADPLAVATPILFGPSAASLTLTPPAGDGRLHLDSPGPGAAFPPEAERFVGRLRLLLQANAALAPEGQARGVLFHGMAGAGKTACALELAWRHERERFTHWAWYKAPDQDSDVADSLGACLTSLEDQLLLPPGELVPYLHDPELFRQRTLPQLSQLLGSHAVCLCLDNLEGLLSASGEWRIPLWGELIATLLDHHGRSRVILTSRLVPRALANHPALVRLPLHALSLAEAALLLREMKHTATLFEDLAGLALLRRLLAVVQGHPKLLEMADHLAEDHAALAARLGDAPETPEVRAFFETGETTRGEAAFVAQLGDWAEAAFHALDPSAQKLLLCLAGMEEEDRNRRVLEMVWDEVMETTDRARLDPTLAALTRCGLVELHEAARVSTTVGAGEVRAGLPAINPHQATYTLHPAIAERLRSLAEPEALVRLDRVMGAYWLAVFLQAHKYEAQELGSALTTAARRAIPYLMRREKWGTTSYLLEQLLHREQSSSTLAYALPRLERIAEATSGTDREAIDRGTLASALLLAGRYKEAECSLRQGMAQAVATGDYYLATGLAGSLLELIMQMGELDQALTLAEKMAEYSRRASLGPWSQLGDEVQRLQVFNALGRCREVLDRVETLLPQLAALPKHSEAKEVANPWNVHETLLDTGRFAASELKAWQLALDLNAELLQLMQARGANATQIARARFNYYYPLLRLNRLTECRALLEDCLSIYAGEHDIPTLGRTYSALADLENEEGHPDRAIAFDQGALKYYYQLGQPKACANSHHNLANYLERNGAWAGEVLAQRLAAAVICYQIGSGSLRTNLYNLTSTSLPVHPPTFAEVAAIVERLEGVRFRELFASLPARAPTGDAAIAAVWEMAQAMQ